MELLTFTCPSPFSRYLVSVRSGFMNRRMPRPEDVSRNHIDATVMGFLSGEKDANWTEISLVTLHPREELRLVLKENADRYRTLNGGRFRELISRLRFQGVALQAGSK